MKIENLRLGKRNNRERISATVVWEDCDRPSQEIFFETTKQFSGSLTCNPDAFLTACIIPAMHYGEERAYIDACVCPYLQSGLVTVMNWLRYWYYPPNKKNVSIETKKQRNFSANPKTKRRAGFFFSGGIDSFAVLKDNHINFPSQHPWYIKDGLLVYGLELDKPEAFGQVIHSLSKVAQEIDIELIPVYTNIYLNYRQEDASNAFSFWIYQFQGAALAAVAHAFSRRLSTVSIGATFDLPNLGHWGSHPLLDPNFSSFDLQIQHQGLTFSRLEKVKLVANCDQVLQHIRVCNRGRSYNHSSLNCGKCEKCIRTMLEFYVLGVLNRINIFADQTLSAEKIRMHVHVHDNYVESCYRDLLDPLARKGRQDLVYAIRRKLRDYHDPGWKKTLKQKTIWPIARFDRKYFNGNLRKLKSLFHT